MLKLKEKGHNVDLTNIVIHKINKAAGEKKAVLKLASKEIKAGKPEIKFIADIRESFNKRSVPTHGVFEDAYSYNGFQQAITDYKEGKIDFMTFSKKSMDYYKVVIESSPPATGGFLIFSDYKITDKNNERYILILSIDNKQGYSLSEAALAIKEIQNLELNKMDLAAIVNLTRWSQVEAPDNDVRTYLTFIRGKKKISDYFQSFIGCADKTTATESSSALVKALDSYFTDYGFDSRKCKELKSKIFGYCQECNKNRKEISLSNISYLIDNDNPDGFLLYASDEKFGNSEAIKYDSKVLRTLKYIDYHSEDLTIKFNKELVGKTIKYNRDKKTITISNLPDELIAQF